MKLLFLIKIFQIFIKKMLKTIFFMYSYTCKKIKILLTKVTNDWTVSRTGFPAAWIALTARSCVLFRKSMPSTSIILSPICKHQNILPPNV